MIGAASLASVQLVSPDSGEPIDRWPFAGGTPGFLRVETTTSVAFGSDMVATLSADGRVRTAAPEPDDATIFDSQLTGELSLDLDEERGRIVVAGPEGAMRLSLNGAGLISRSVPTGGLYEFFVSNDGQTVLGSTVDELPSTMWRLVGDEYRVAPISGPTVHFAFTGMPGGLGIDLSTLMMQERDPVTFEPFGPVYGPHRTSEVLTSPDGRWLALSVDPPGDVVGARVYERSTGEVAADLDEVLVDPKDAIRSLGFSPDSNRMVVTSMAGAARVYDTATWKPLEPMLSGGGGAVVGAAFTPDGKHLVTASIDGTITVRDPATFQPDGLAMLGNTGAVEGQAVGSLFSPDGHWMVTTMDGEARLWDLAQRVVVGRPFPHNGEANPMASANARYVLTHLDGRTVVWELDLDRWPEIACRAAGRNLTIAEWEQYGPAGEPYIATCPQWPSPDQIDDNGGAS